MAVRVTGREKRGGKGRPEKIENERERESELQITEELAGLIKGQGVSVQERGHIGLTMHGGAVGCCWEARRLGCKPVQRRKGT
ncbi:hypothetical protein CRG98_008777 [Punica granatum]|uniref:Uncharacterized protein n=1 Tax=Punica granatum TaxID=22663 RepID=A0A2I0KSS9_PUNGR|nr:hypothetical protein CRG98_008777 [Punica granatum]